VREEPTTTSYALLGLLSLRPWTTYELVKQMKKSMVVAWPRAARAIYDEPKNLVARGLATAKTEMHGRRRRTVYRITPAGRRALKRWLSEPSAAPHFESEALLRATFAEHGSKADLLAAIRSLRGHADGLRTEIQGVVDSYRESQGAFPGRLHIIGLVGRFNLEYAALLEQWSRWAEAEVEGWEDTTEPAVFPEALNQLYALLRELPPAMDNEEHGRPASQPRSRLSRGA
jgi:DNA-binding PadR family transcriptional regulator